MCLSKSSVGFRAVSKVTSTNCWHNWIESTTKAQRNLHCLVRQNTPHIPAERKDTKWLFAIFDDLKSKQDLWIFSSWVLQFQVQLGYKPNSYSICLEALASPLKTGPEFMHSSPGSWWITCFSQDYWNVGGKKRPRHHPVTFGVEKPNIHLGLDHWDHDSSEYCLFACRLKDKCTAAIKVVWISYINPPKCQKISAWHWRKKP